MTSSLIDVCHRSYRERGLCLFCFKNERYFLCHHQGSVLGACPKTKNSIDRLVIKIIFSIKSIPTIATNGRIIKFPGFLPRSSQKTGDISSVSSSLASFLFFLFLLPRAIERMVFEVVAGDSSDVTAFGSAVNELAGFLFLDTPLLGAG